MALLWSDDRTAKLHELLKLNLSASQMGERLGITRNAVIGKINRMGLSIQANYEYRLGHMVNGGRRVGKNPVKLPQNPVPKATLTYQAPLNIPFRDLQKFHCREITGTGEDGLAVYCGHKRQEERAYCAYHQKVNYYKPQPSPRYFVR